MEHADAFRRWASAAVKSEKKKKERDAETEIGWCNRVVDAWPLRIFLAPTAAAADPQIRARKGSSHYLEGVWRASAPP